MCQSSKEKDMNKEIQQLALQCGAWHQVYDHKSLMVDRHFDIEKFAELIVKECADVATINQFQYDAVGNYVLKHFGVE
jgi:hypothetical protein